MWDSLQESGNTQSLTFSPEIGGGQGPPGVEEEEEEEEALGGSQRVGV